MSGEPTVEELKITPEEAKTLFDRGQAVFLDTRSAESWAGSDEQLPGALRRTPEQVLAQAGRWRPGTAVIAYCT